MAMMKRTARKHGIIGWGRACGWMLLGLSQSIFVDFRNSLQEQNNEQAGGEACRKNGQAAGSAAVSSVCARRAAIVCFTAATAP